MIQWKKQILSLFMAYIIVIIPVLAMDNSFRVDTSSNTIKITKARLSTEITLFRNDFTYSNGSKMIRREKINDVTYNHETQRFNSIDRERPRTTGRFGPMSAGIIQLGDLFNYSYLIDSNKPLIVLRDIIGNVTDFIGGQWKNSFKIYNFEEIDYNKENRIIYDFEDICDKEQSNCTVHRINETAWLLNFFSNGTIDPTIQNLTTCKTLFENHTTYIINETLHSATDCIVIACSNCTVDGKGNKINYTGFGTHWGINTGYGLRENITVKNTVVWNFTRGYRIDTALNVEMENNTYYRKYDAASVLTRGFQFTSSDNIHMDVANITGVLTNEIFFGLLATNSNHYLNISHLYCLGQKTHYCVTIEALTDTYLYDSNVNGRDYDLYMNSYYQQSVRLMAINVTSQKKYYAPYGVIWTSWYYTAFVNDSFGNPVNGVNFSFYDRYGEMRATDMSNNYGFINKTIVLESRFRNVNGFNYTANYTIKARKGNAQDNMSKNITDNINFDIYTLEYGCDYFGFGNWIVYQYCEYDLPNYDFDANISVKTDGTMNCTASICNFNSTSTNQYMIFTVENTSTLKTRLAGNWTVNR